MRSIFFSSVAHELRTPLNSILPIIRLIFELIKSKTLTIEKLVEYLSIIQSSSTHLYNVVEDALDVSRLENNKFKLNMVNFKIRDACKEVQDIM